jgi:RNA polymerase sigma-70 factor, ECF subfamily
MATARIGGSVRRSPDRLAELEAIYRRGYSSFLRVCVGIVGDVELAADAVHDGFVGAVRGRERYRGDGTLEAWVWRAVVNAAKRRRGLARRSAAEALAADVPAEDGDVGLGDPVREAIAALPERQRLVLFLRYFADLDYRTIAEVVGIETGTVGATLHAAREAIRLTLEEARP